jgi:hypothetical protein
LVGYPVYNCLRLKTEFAYWKRRQCVDDASEGELNVLMMQERES